MMISDVIDVHVSGDGCHGSIENILCELAKTGNAHPRVNHQVPIASANMPDVAAKKWDDVRFEN
jgi:hypothetical protein